VLKQKYTANDPFLNSAHANKENKENKEHKEHSNPNNDTQQTPSIPNLDLLFKKRRERQGHSNIFIPGSASFNDHLKLGDVDPNFKPTLMINRFKGNAWEFTDKKRSGNSFHTKVEELRGNQSGIVKPGMNLGPDRWAKNGWRYTRDVQDPLPEAQRAKQRELSHNPLDHRHHNSTVLVTDKWNKEGWKYVDHGMEDFARWREINRNKKNEGN